MGQSNPPNFKQENEKQQEQAGNRSNQADQGTKKQNQQSQSRNKNEQSQRHDPKDGIAGEKSNHQQ